MRRPNKRELRRQAETIRRRQRFLQQMAVDDEMQAMFAILGSENVASVADIKKNTFTLHDTYFSEIVKEAPVGVEV